MENNTQNLSMEINKELKKIKDNIKRPNILVCGGTGVGKSSLINMVLKDPKNKAKVGAGKPVTNDIKKYEGDLVIVYDSPGYESGDEAQENYKKIVLSLIDSEDDLANQIHLVWYCISQGNHRILDIDIETIINIKNKNIPIAIILTQADKGSEESAKAMQAVLAKNCKGIHVFETSIDEKCGMSMDPLIDWSIENLEDSLKSSFIANINSIDHKFAEGKKIVIHHIAAAGAIAVSPIPFSDSILLTANQATLIARLAHLWNFSEQKSLIVGSLPGVFVSNVGRSLAGNLLKLLPGAGSAAGATINAVVASSITAGIGYALNSIFEKMAKDEIAGKKVDLTDYLKELPGLINTFTKSYKS